MFRGRIAPFTLATLGALALGGCPPEPPPQRPLPPPPVDRGTPLPPPRPDGRLPALATPTHIALDLDVDPGQPSFHGTTRIDVDLPARSSFVVLHGHALRVAGAAALVSTGAGPRSVPARASTRAAAGASTGAQAHVAEEELVLDFGDPLPAGHATLVLDYEAAFDESLAGLYRLQDGGAWYAFSQFEPTDARRAFPCFDEPSFKVPYDVTITVPPGMIALANAPETSKEQVPADGKTRFHFATTPPLPSYLVAFAVGDFVIEEGKRFTKPPLRIVTTKSKAGNTALALEAAGGIVDALADWFAIPYPYAKLDLVAVPDFEAGAMENAGLVTFREEFLLLDPARTSRRSRREQALTIAHELAHQWFGDLVTATWWNDLWLNEGMATWMEARIVDAWRPAFGTKLDAVVSTQRAMDVDGLVSARAVRQPVVSTAEAEEAFDEITYTKGGAVLQTIERWVGDAAFQKGIRDYLHDNSWKSVEASKLFAALDHASSKDVTQMASAYLDKPGVPEVAAALECERGGRWHATLTPQPWRPLGSKLPEDDRSWTVPVCIRVQGEKKDTCTELQAGAPSMLGGRGCPQWIHPNMGSSYYRFSLPEKDFVHLAEARAQLDIPARVTLLANAWAAVRSGELEASAMLKILPLFDDDKTRQVVVAVVDILEEMDESLVDDAARPAFKKFALARLGPRKKALGWGANTTAATATTKKTDAESDDVLVRATVLRAMGNVVQDEATLKEAADVSARWLADPATVDPELVPVALDLASRNGPESRIQLLLGAMKTAKTKEDRIALLEALIGFDDAQRLGRAMDATLGDDVHPDEMGYVVRSALRRRTSRLVGEIWVRTHWDELTKKLPGLLGGVLVRAAGVGCSAADLAERTAFYGPRAEKVEGAARSFAGALEEVSLCAALHEKGAPSLRKALLPSTGKR